MLYALYQAQADAMEPVRALARLNEDLMANPLVSMWFGPFAGQIKATNRLIGRGGLFHERPAYNIPDVTEEVIVGTPFADLLHFKREGWENRPKVLVTAAMSGHFATLTRGTVAGLLARGLDVYITDWKNARDIPVAEGPFDLSGYIEHVVYFLAILGDMYEDVNVIAICQSAPAVLAAVSLMYQRNFRNVPKTMTLMAGPVDVTVNPTQIDRMAHSMPLDLLRKIVITNVPSRFAGAGRRVYPGFLQISNFVNMNLGAHIQKYIVLFNRIAQNKMDEVAKTESFYDEYLTVMDATEEFVMTTCEDVFVDPKLPKGELVVSGDLVDPSAITRTALLTLEGENDEFCSIGQTNAAQSLATSLDDSQRHYEVIPGVGHYGVFNGSKFDKYTSGVIADFIASH